MAFPRICLSCDEYEIKNAVFFAVKCREGGVGLKEPGCLLLPPRWEGVKQNMAMDMDVVVFE